MERLKSKGLTPLPIGKGMEQLVMAPWIFFENSSAALSNLEFQEKWNLPVDFRARQKT